MIHFIKYAGTKIKYVDLINKEIDKTKNKIYVEPFLGSGSVFLNLNKKFNKYILSDIDTNIITIFNSFKNGNYTLFKNCENTIFNKFGDIRNNKESYYNFRNDFNVNIWKTNTVEEGFYLYFLFNSCINSMARFGPNGFNQSFGNRFKTMSEINFNEIKNKLNNTEIYNKSFFDLNIPDNAVLFLDPPYIEKQTMNYTKIDQKWFLDFINFIKNYKGEIIYTDTLHDYIDWNYKGIRTIKNISPNRKNTNEHLLKEVIYTNF